MLALLFWKQLVERIDVQAQFVRNASPQASPCEGKQRKALAWDVKTPRPGVNGKTSMITAALEKIAKADEGTD